MNALCEIPRGAGKVVCMTQWGGTVIIATEFAVFRLIGGALVPIPFLAEPSPLERARALDLQNQQKAWKEK